MALIYASFRASSFPDCHLKYSLSDILQNQLIAAQPVLFYCFQIFCIITLHYYFIAFYSYFERVFFCLPHTGDSLASRFPPFHFFACITHFRIYLFFGILASVLFVFGPENGDLNHDSLIGFLDIF